MSMQTNNGSSCVKSYGANESGAQVAPDWRADQRIHQSQEWQGQRYSQCGLGASAWSRNFLEIHISKDLLEIWPKDTRCIE